MTRSWILNSSRWVCQCGEVCEQFIYGRTFVIVSDVWKENGNHDEEPDQIQNQIGEGLVLSLG